jgi:transglutaminase-like putative cysteine protease
MSTLWQNIEQRLEQVAKFFRLPCEAYDPAAEVAWEGQGTWLRLSLVAWLMMAASLAATWLVVRPHWIMIELTVLLGLAFIVSYRMHFRSTSRLLANWFSFTAALVTAIPHFWLLWSLYKYQLFTDGFEPLSFLLLGFLWITVYRAFALRTVQDLVQTILPCGSILLLVLLIRPVMLALACLAVVVMAVLILLTYEHRLTAKLTCHPLTSLTSSHAGRPAGRLYSWPTIYVLATIVAVLVAYGAAHSQYTDEISERLRIAMARHMTRWFISRQALSIPDNSVMLSRMDGWSGSDMPVFRAYTKTPGNWRTSTYHTYTGTWWQRHVRPAEVSLKSKGWHEISLVNSGASHHSATYVEQKIIPIKNIVGTVPTLFCPVAIDLDQRIVRYDHDRILHLQQYLSPGQVYRVISYIPPVLPIQRPDTEVSAEVLALDLQLPDTLPRRVYDLAAEITREAETPLEKARAIEQHLMYSYEYSLQVSPSGRADFVDHFLFTTQSGFCHHFAGSMVILCRTLGLPARLAAGFLPGDESLKEPDLYTVRERDAHVWPEVYFAGAGWVTFEPTPPEPEQRRLFTEAWEGFIDNLKHFGQQMSRLPYDTYLAALIGLLLAASLVLLWRRLPAVRVYRQQAKTPTGRLVRAYQQVRRELVATGTPAGETLAPREVLARAPYRDEELQQELRYLTEKYLIARFSARQWDETQALAYESRAARFRQAWRQRSRQTKN